VSQMPPDMARLPALFEQQRQACARLPMPSADHRLAGLRRLRAALLAHREALIEAVNRDYSARSRDETLMAEMLTTVQGIDHAIRHLKRWMKPSRRPVSILFAPATNRVEYQPLGVVGIMVPWNYPIYLSLMPLVGALSAGNRAMIKLSEFTPSTNRVLRAMLASVFDEDEVAVIEGAVEVSTLFADQPWDHLFFTGSTAVGRVVMAAAARHLTPVTLELGGKSPVLIARDAPLQVAADSVVYGKMLNAGQTCIAPDYVLVPAGQEEAFVQAVQRAMDRMYPSLLENPDVTAIVNERQHQRLQALRDDAIRQGARVHLCHPAGERLQGTRKMPLHLLLGVHEGMQVMQEEIFGPLLPVVPYRDLDQALERIRSGPRPLALYLFSHDREVQRQVLDHTHSGGVTINDTIMHVAQDDLPFGGIGPSGMGQYHGHEGFLTFSNARGVHSKGRLNTGRLVYPPYGGWMHRLIQRWFIR
jgi:coniferyl-aldehyde dehydrogenase